MTDTAQLNWRLDEDTEVRPFAVSEAGVMYRCIQANRDHLDRWLRWSHTIQSEADAALSISAAAASREQGLGFHSGIWIAGELGGGMVCRDYDPQHRRAEIGYWLGAGFTGRGLATRGATAMIDYLFSRRNLHRVEMQCGVNNRRSRAIPERLGFQLEGIRRESHRITTEFVDHAVYGLLAREWKSGAGRPARYT